jgi:hypothetical protein
MIITLQIILVKVKCSGIFLLSGPENDDSLGSTSPISGARNKNQRIKDHLGNCGVRSFSTADEASST